MTSALERNHSLPSPIKMNITIRTKLFLSHFLAILLVSGAIGIYFYNSAIDHLLGSLKTRLKYSAALMSQSFDAGELDQLRSSSDVDTPQYLRNLELVRKFSDSNPDVAFVYVMRLRAGNPVFVLDSDTEDPAQLGEEYPEQIPTLMQGFTQISVDSKVTRDRWGSFISGYAPISGGTSQYLVGIDMRADQVSHKLNQLRVCGAVSLLLAVLLAYSASYFLSKHLLRRIEALHGRCVKVSSQMVQTANGDELDGLTQAFSTMLDDVQNAQRELEGKVQERTAELQNANALLIEEIEERKKVEAALRISARTDYLTGLINRREMVNMLHAAISQNRQFHISFSVILLDIDNFKRINDEIGHSEGDEVLKASCQILLREMREKDTLARWGGEELLILLPDTEQTEAVLQAEKARSALERSPIQVGSQFIAVTASFGVAEYYPMRGLEHTLKQADLALYRAKQQGRNRVMIAEEYFAVDDA